MADITPKQERFCQEYLVDLNATQAAVRAGYSPKTANEQGAQLLAKLSERVEELKAERASRLQIEADAVLQEVARLGFSNILDYVKVNERGLAAVNLAEMTREQAAAISEITSDQYVEGKGDDARLVVRTKIKLVDKRASLELLGRHLGLFNKVSVDVTDKRPDLRNVPIEKLAMVEELLGDESPDS